MILNRFLIKVFLSYFEIACGIQYVVGGIRDLLPPKEVVENISLALVSMVCVTTKVNLSNDNVTNTVSLCTVYGDDIYLCYRDKARL